MAPKAKPDDLKEELPPAADVTPDDLPTDDDTLDTAENQAEVEVKPSTYSVINLPHEYGGRRTGEKRIPAGLYRADDPILMGLADYLVASGHATGN